MLWCLDSWNVNFKNPYKKIKDSLGSSMRSEADESEVLGGGKDLDEFNFDIPCQFEKLPQTDSTKNKKLLVYTLAYNETIGFQNPYFTD